MRRLTQLAPAMSVAFLVVAGTAHGSAANVYLTQDGSSQTHCTGTPRFSPAQFDDPANWGTGAAQIGPGTVVHACGTISSELDPRGDGTAAQPITFFFEPGAKVSAPVSPGNQFMYWNGRAFWIIDGGIPCGAQLDMTCNGQLSATNVGSALGSQVGQTGISLSDGAHDIEIKNMELGPFYIHSSLADDNPSNYDSSGLIYANNNGSNIHIHDNKIHDDAWCFGLQVPSANSNLEVDHNNIYNCSHGFVIGNHFQANNGGLAFHDNLVAGPVNWDTTDNAFHHDGIHIFGSFPTAAPASTISNIYLYSNTFYGDWGHHNTSALFIEVHEPLELVQDIWVFNNTFTNSNNSGGTWADGINLIGHSGIHALNNTVICSAAGGAGLDVGGSGMDVRNNVESHCAGMFGTSNEQSSIAQMDHNVYGELVASGSGAFNLNLELGGQTTSSSSSLAAQLTQWKAIVGGGFEGASVSGTTSLDAVGVPQPGSLALTTQGENLTSLCAGGLLPLCRDRNGSARPATGAWTPGAFQAGGAVPGPQAPTLLTATAH